MPALAQAWYFLGNIPAENQTGQTGLPAAQIEAFANLDDTAGLTSFVDGIMEKDMNRLQIPGAVISIVKDGKIILVKVMAVPIWKKRHRLIRQPACFESLQQQSCSPGQR